MDLVIEAMLASDYPAVSAIFDEGIATKNATFETFSPSRDEWDASHLQTCRLVARAAGEVVGWAALSPTSSRWVYRGVAEVSLYVTERARGAGAGNALMRALIEASEVEGIWTLQAGIFPENQISVRLHEKHGFRVVGARERIGKMDEKWRDVLLLERRSNTAEG